MQLRNIETWIRKARIALFKRVVNSRRGRKFLLDALPGDVIDMTLDRDDHSITVAPNEMIGRHVFASGDYTRGAVSHVLGALDRRQLLPETGACLLELGSNIGTHTIYFALTERFNRIIAVEPDPRNVGLLRRNIEQNGLTDLVQIAECAAGEEAGELVLHRVEGNYGNSSFMHDGAAGESVTVAVKPVGAILQDANADFDDISLIWMDVEGFEPQVCRGMIKLLQRQVPLYVEFSPEFYGEEGTRSFAGFLAGFYDQCIVTRRGAHELISVRDLADIKRQCDVLLLPS